MDAPTNGSAQGPQAPIDPITLGQLKAAMANSMKPKVRVESCQRVGTSLIGPKQQSWYDYKYDDEDTVMTEIEEFYSYVEMPQTAENLKAWKDSYMPGAFIHYVSQHRLS